MLVSRKDRKQVLVNLLDVDGCLYHKARPDQQVARWLFESNKALIAQLKREIQEKNYHRIVFGLGSNRQDNNIDSDNLSKTGRHSFLPLLPLMQEYFAQSHFDREVLFDSFMMADIFTKFQSGKKTQSGKSFQDILLSAPNTDYAKTRFDHSKVSLVYAHAHRAALLNPDADVTINLIDDNLEILQSLSEFFNANPDQLPKNVRLHLTRYANSQIDDKNVFSEIKGSGALDRCYDWTTRYMAARTGKKIKNVAHAKALYDDQASQEIDSDISDDSLRIGGLSSASSEEIFCDRIFKIDRKQDVLRFRRNEIGQLQSTLTLDGYTTARQLAKSHVALGYRLIDNKFKLDLSKAEREQLAEILALGFINRSVADPNDDKSKDGESEDDKPKDDKPKDDEVIIFLLNHLQKLSRDIDAMQQNQPDLSIDIPLFNARLESLKQAWLLTCGILEEYINNGAARKDHLEKFKQQIPSFELPRNIELALMTNSAWMVDGDKTVFERVAAQRLLFFSELQKSIESSANLKDKPAKTESGMRGSRN